VDGAGNVAVSGPVPITAEGVHDVEYHSVDRSQNVERAKRLTVQIDKTAPEVVISFDPVQNDFLITGRDSLSGVDPAPVKPDRVTPTEWTDFGSDVAEIRVYEIRDRADNKTTLVLKVRCSPETYEASVLAIRYDDEGHSDNADNLGHDLQRGNRTQHQRNTIVFERLVGRNSAHPLLGVKQIVSIGEDGSRATVRARYDVLDDLTLLVHETGSPCCAERANMRPRLEVDMRGLLLLHVATHRGYLVVEE